MLCPLPRDKFDAIEKIYTSMNIIINSDSQLAILTEYFKFNQILHDEKSLWSYDNDPHGRYLVPESTENTLLIIDSKCLKQLLEWEVTRNQLLEYCQTNYIWVFGQFDTFIYYIKIQRMLENLDADARSKNITLFSEANIANRCFLSKLTSIRVKTWPHHWQLYMPRIRNSTVDKIHCKHDFLLTMIKKRTHPHRNALWNELTGRPGLLGNGHAYFRDRSEYSKTFVGDVVDRNGSPSSASPSMDLYRTCWLELVPETLYNNGYFITEKTVKPIATKTPFLLLSTCGYLKYLRSLGFKTFGTLIDEKYDDQYRYQDRARLLTDQLENIIKNGSESFYHASKPILEHNHSVLAEISGSWTYNMDQFINQCLTEVFNG